MTEIIVFPDIESAARDYLVTELANLGDDAEVVTHIPDPRPSRMVKLLRTGGPRTGLVLEDAQLTYECWAARLDDAHDLAQLVRALLHVMPGRYQAVTTYRVQELGGPVNMPDPDTDTPRYTGTLLITARGYALAAESS